MTLKDRLKTGVENQQIRGSDPHGNIHSYLGSSGSEVDRFYGLLDEFVHRVVPLEERMHLESLSATDSEKLTILTKAIMRVPFDYLGNSVKTARYLQEGRNLTLKETLGENDFHYLRTPAEVLEGFLQDGTGGDCFSTSFLAQALFSTYDISSRMSLSHDRPKESNIQERKHHCVVLSEADGKNYYIDTSLNVEVPIEYGNGEHDSGEESSIFRLRTLQDGNLVRVSYVPKTSLKKQGIKAYARETARSLIKGPVTLWHFGTDGNPLSEILPSMLYTLHPNVPPIGTNNLNRNQQLRISAHINGEEGRGRRERIFYNEARASYLSRPIEDQLQLETTKLEAGHDPETGRFEGDVSGLIGYVAKTFGVNPNVVQESIRSLDYINSRGHIDG